jgi:hypothetical protein
VQNQKKSKRRKIMNNTQRKVNLGTSACRQLVLRTPEQVVLLEFAADGPYEAQLVGEQMELPEEQLVLSGSRWLRIYDDNELTFLAQADQIRVYAEGDSSCLVQLDGHANVEKTVTMRQAVLELQNLVNQMAAQK